MSGNAATVGAVLVKGSSEEAILGKRGYTLDKLLGEGSYAKVYLAEFKDAKTGKSQKLACKLINGSAAPKDFLKKFFPREVEIMSRVNHPYLIRVHSILQRKNKYFIFMQYCENGDLLDFIRTNGAVDEKQSRQWFSQLVRGLKYMHDRDIVHRDLKCENVLLTSSYNIKLSDFGFARYYHPDKDAKSETFCGSVSYAAPEIIRGIPYDPKLSDIWSVGIILFIMLNKGMPFDDGSLRKLYESQMTRSWKFRTKVKDKLSPEIKNFMYKLLEPAVDKRIPLEKMNEDPWFHLDAELPSGKSANGDPHSTKTAGRASIFLSAPVHHNYTTDAGVTIMDADTEAIEFSRKVFPLPNPLSAPTPETAPDSVPGNGPSTSRGHSTTPKSKTKKSDSDEIPLTGVWSKAGRLSEDEQ